MAWTPSVLPERKRRPLPEADETIDSLTDAQREFVASSCARRAELELRGAASFAIVTNALVALRAPAIRMQGARTRRINGKILCA